MTVIKKIAAVLSVILFLLFSSCADNKGASAEPPLSPEDLIKYIQQEKAEVRKALSLDEMGLSSMDPGDLLIRTWEMNGSPYQLLLMYDRDNHDILYGFRYVLTGNPDELMPILDAWMENFKNQYGEPSTYPGLGTRYYGDQNPAEVFAKHDALSETWDLSGISPFKETLTGPYESMYFVLQVTLEKTDDGAMLSIIYKVQGYL